MQHIDETDWSAEAKRNLVVVVHDSCKLILVQKFAHHLQVHLALLHLDLERTRRIHRPVLIILDNLRLLTFATILKLLQLLLFQLGLLQEVIEGLAKLDG